MLLADTFGEAPSRAECLRLRAEVDADGDGYITLDEFTRAMATVPTLQHCGDMYKWKAMFVEADEDQSGYLSYDEVCGLLDRVWTGDGEQLHLLKQTVKENDSDGDGGAHKAFACIRGTAICRAPSELVDDLGAGRYLLGRALCDPVRLVLMSRCDPPRAPRLEGSFMALCVG